MSGIHFNKSISHDLVCTVLAWRNNAQTCGQGVGRRVVAELAFAIIFPLAAIETVVRAIFNVIAAAACCNFCMRCFSHNALSDSSRTCLASFLYLFVNPFLKRA